MVFLTALGLGGVAHFLLLSLPLAACIALGASLAPTDAIAVSALSKNFKFPKRVTSILQGEGLLNDASGIITFQFAVLALTTGEFSLPRASLELVFAILGGIAIGLILVSLQHLILNLLEYVAARDVIGYLMLEFILPLAAFMLAEVLHVSGIIAVVTAGMMQASGLHRPTLFDAQVAKVKNTIWDLLIFMLNSVVFLFLGIELHQLITPLINNPLYSNTRLIFMVLLLTIGLFVLRFVFLLLYYRLRTWRLGQPFGLFWNDILLLTFAGSKGTVSIATILLIPRVGNVPHSLLIFLVAAVTGLSFLVGLFTLPILANKKNLKVDNMTRIAILTDVVAELRKDLERAHKKEGYALAIDSYQDRIQRLMLEQGAKDAHEASELSFDFNELQLLMIRLEDEGLELALRNGEISLATYRIYQRYIRSLSRSIGPSFVSSLQFVSLIVVRALHSLLVDIGHGQWLERHSKHSGQSNQEIRDQITTLYLRNTEIILEALENLATVYDNSLIDFLQTNRLHTAELVAHGGYITRVLHRVRPHNLHEMMRAYYLERKAIFEYETAGRLTPKEAKKLRQTVNTLEDFAMESSPQNLLANFLERRRK